MSNIKNLYYKLVKKSIFGYFLFGIFIVIFFLPILNLAMLAFADKYQYPSFLPNAFSFKWWSFVLNQGNLAGAMVNSLIIAIATTVISIIICIPAAYAFARYDFPFRKAFLFSFLMANAFPKIGLYVMIGVVFFKLNLMGTMPGIVTASVFTFLASMEESQGTLLIGMPNIKTIPVVMYSVVVDYPATAGAVLAIILIIPTIMLLIFLRKSVGAEALSKGFTMK